MWAILSGIEGNLVAYEAVLADLKRSRLPIEELYILGDVIAPTQNNLAVIQRIRSPRTSELKPQVCQGWWEEQLLILHGLGRTGEPTELIERYGKPAVKTLWDSVPRKQVEWVRSLDFGYFELDCLMIHGSTVSVSDELTPDTAPIHMLDRLLRTDANTLFCGRSGLAFQYEIQQGSMTSAIATLDSPASPQTATVQPRQIVGVGSVGRIPGQSTYTLYQPNTGRIEFKTVRYGTANTKGVGFQVSGLRGNG